MKILTVVGARPQFIKAAAVSRALAQHGGLVEIMVHTGQHYDLNMSDVFFTELAIPAPTYNLGINSGSHGEMTGRMLTAIESVIIGEKPAKVLVYGDTNSTLAGALAAAKLHVPVGHIEAGLRSYNKSMPEEINRVLTDHVSALLFCPTHAAVANLAKEGIASGVHHVGDVMYDVTLAAAAEARRTSRILETLQLAPGAYAVATIHRAENTDDPRRLGEIVVWLNREADRQPVIVPLHPRTKQSIAAAGIDSGALRLVPPLGYLDMSRLLDGASTVFTDSGGLQKEAYFHRKPCVTLREETEWIETIEAGWNRLWRVAKYRPRHDIDEYGDGHAADRIAEILVDSADG